MDYSRPGSDYSISLRMHVLVLVVLLYAGFVFEWSFNRLSAIQAGYPLIYSYINNTLLFPSVPLFWYVQQRSWKWDAVERVYVPRVILLAIAMLAIILIERIHISSFDTSPSLRACIPLAVLPVWICMGIWFTRDLRVTKILLHTLALAGAVASLISFGLRALGFSNESLLGPMYWPYYYIVAFGFFYYLSSWLVGRRGNWQSMLGILVCAMETLFTFKKSVIISTTVGLVGFGVVGMMIQTGMRRLFLGRLVLFAAGAAVAIIIVNAATGGLISSVVEETFESSWIPRSDIRNLNRDPLTLADQLGTGRLEMWNELPDRISASPWVGCGLFPFLEGTKVTHNGYIDILLSVGVLGALVFAAGLALWLAAVASSRAKGDAAVLQLACVSYIFCIFAGWTGLSVWLLFPTIDTYMALLGGISLGLAARSRADKRVRR